MAAAKQHKLSTRMRRTIGMIVAACMIAIASLFASAGSASAAPGGCHGSAWGWLTSDICVQISSGGKDAITRSEYISWVEGYGDGTATFMEVWGDGFYYSWYGTKARYDLNRWVRSGTFICAAETDHERNREIACVAIRV